MFLGETLKRELEARSSVSLINSHVGDEPCDWLWKRSQVMRCALLGFFFFSPLVQAELALTTGDEVEINLVPRLTNEHSRIHS